MDKKAEDSFLGRLNEDYIEDVICTHFKYPKIKKLDRFHPMDFYYDGNYFEIKARQFKHDKYITTMLGYNKIKWANNHKDYNIYFVFVFDDGDYYYKYNPEDIFETSLGGRVDRGQNEIKLYYYIPINKLIKII
jgi:hypothetical protein